MQKVPILRDPKWLVRLRDFPCVLTGQPGPNDPAHIRKGCFSAGMKPPDNLVLPLSHDLHVLQHQIGEVKFWCKYLPSNPDLLMECVKAYAEKFYGAHNEI